MWPFSKTPEKTPEPTKAIKVTPYIELRVFQRDGSYLTWKYRALDEHIWRNFKTWFHGRPKSETYSIEHKDGSTGILRSEIKYYEIKRGRD